MILIFLCRHSMKPDRSTPANILAKNLISRGLATVGTLQDLSAQHKKKSSERYPMLFLNDCSSSCLKVIAARFNDDEYLYLNVNDYTTENEILHEVARKWKSEMDIQPTMQT